MNEVLRDAGGKLPLLESEVLPAGFSHAFTTRAAGPEGGLFNLAVGWAQDGAERQVLEDRDRLKRVLGAEKVFVATQVHGAAVVRVAAGDLPEDVAARRADALVTDVPGFALGVFTADCVPVLLADPVTGACAAVHAGWRGVVARVVSAAVKEMVASYGVRPADLRAALGPAIGRCCFEVGAEVVAEFEGIIDAGKRAGFIFAGGGPSPRPSPRSRGEREEEAEGEGGEKAGKAWVDLRGILRTELETLGVPTAQIDEGGECTRCDPGGRFFSFRRDGKAGQQMALIVRRAVSTASP